MYSFLDYSFTNSLTSSLDIEYASFSQHKVLSQVYHMILRLPYVITW